MKTSTLISLVGAVAVMGAAAPASAQQIEAFIGQIIQVGYSFCPSGWADANGQLLSIPQYAALYSLYGTTFGGNGTTNFALPDLQGRVAMDQGAGAGLPPAIMGQKLGNAQINLTLAQLPPHSHALMGNSAAAAGPNPAGASLATFPAADKVYATTGTPNTPMAPGSIGVAGLGQPVDLHQPSLVIRYCVALTGIFPSRP